MVILLLTSSGLKRDKCGQIHKEASEALGLQSRHNWAGKSVAYCDTALGGCRRPVRHLIASAYGSREHLDKMLGATIVDLDLESMTAEKVAAILRDVHVLYLEGGDPFKLLYWARQRQLGAAIRSCEKLLVIGCSAGAMILGRDIAVARDLAIPWLERIPTWGKQDTTALGLMPSCFRPHANDPLRKLIGHLRGYSPPPKMICANDGDCYCFEIK